MDKYLTENGEIDVELVFKEIKSKDEKNLLIKMRTKIKTGSQLFYAFLGRNGFSESEFFKLYKHEKHGNLNIKSYFGKKIIEEGKTKERETT